MEAFRFKLGEAMVTIAFLAFYFFAIANERGGFWLPMALVSLAILVPAYLVSLLMWRHYFGASSTKDKDRPGEHGPSSR